MSTKVSVNAVLGRKRNSRVRQAAIEVLEDRRLMSVSFAGGTYSQDFNSLPSTGTSATFTNDVTLSGWHLYSFNNSAVSTVQVGNGGGNAGAFYDFGGTTDRALGGVGSNGASQGSGTTQGWIAASLTNATGGPLNSFEIRYDGEQWRNGGNTTPQTMTVEYGYGATFAGVSTWTAPGAGFNYTSNVNTSTAAPLNGDVAPNRTANIGGTVNSTWGAGQTLWVRFREFNDSGNDHGLAVDNFKLTAGTVTANSVVTLSPTTSQTINETGSPTAVTYTVTRTNPTASAVTVNYVINYGGSATAADLVGAPTGGSVTIPANTASANFSLTAFDDATQESAENFTVTLTSIQAPAPANHVLGGDITGGFTISENDQPPPPPATLGKAPTLIAIADGTQNFGNTQRSIAYYDVSTIDNSGNPGNIFGGTPLFTVWSGYEQTVNNNYEEIAAFTVNPSNGDTYVLSFDSGTPGNVDVVDDTEGDYDLYRYDIGKIYADFIANGRARGTMYMPAVSSDGFDGIAFHGSATPALSGGLGIHPNRDNTDGDTTNDFVFIDAIEKVAEVARVVGIDSDSSNFFDQQDLQFVDAETLLLLENKKRSDPATATAVTDDYSIRSIERISLTPDQATYDATTRTGGFANGNATESWEAFEWSGANYVDMDNFAGGGGISEAHGMRYVEKDGVAGVWLSERDGGGDDFEFRTLDFSTRAVTKPGGYSGFALDEDPVANDNNGDIDGFDVDENGMLVIYESGFNDAPSTEPAVQTVTVDDYSAGPVTIGTSAKEPVASPSLDDDAFVTDGRFSVYERGQNRVYRFDADSGTDPDVRGDVYVYDLDTNTLVYQELNAVNHFTSTNRIRAFTLGDFATTDGSQTSQDGIVDAADIDALYARIADPTVGGRFSSAVGQEMFDLDGDDALTVGDPFTPGTVTGDVDYLVRRVLATEFGDTDLNGSLDFDDISNTDFGAAAALFGWANGDFDGNGVVDFDDISLLDFNAFVNPTPTRV